MSRVTTVVGLGILTLALLVGVGVSQDAKKDKDVVTDKDGKDKAPGKGKSLSSLGFSSKNLKLTKDQTTKMTALSADYDAKIHDLEKKIAELNSQRKAELFKMLTDEQKAVFLKALTGEEFKDKAPPKDADKVEKDKAEKDKN
jgi:hypothetical protein